MKCAYSQTIEINENKELQALEIAKTLCELTPTKEEKDLIVSSLTRLEKLEKVIKIINEKDVNIFGLKTSKNYQLYNLFVIEEDKLTEEEFNILKEVFGNESNSNHD